MDAPDIGDATPGRGEVTARGIVLGLGMIAVTNVWATYSEYYMRSSVVGVGIVPMSVFAGPSFFETPPSMGGGSPPSLGTLPPAVTSMVREREASPPLAFVQLR